MLSFTGILKILTVVKGVIRTSILLLIREFSLLHYTSCDRFQGLQILNLEHAFNIMSSLIFIPEYSQWGHP